MNCSKCGQPVESGVAFCGNCGNPMAQAATASTQSATNSTQAPQASNMSPAAVAPAAGATQVIPKTNVKAIVSLVLGILSVPSGLVPILGVTLGITGLVFGILSRKTNKGGMGLAGIILSSIGIAGSIIFFIIAVIALSAASSLEPA